MNTLERFDAIVERYIRKAKRGNLSPQTVGNYEDTAKCLREFLQDRAENGMIGVDYISFDDIEAWIDDMNESGNKASTIKQRLVVASQIFSFATKPYIPSEIRYGQSPISPDFYPKVVKKNIEEKLSNADIIALWQYDKKYRASDAQFARNYCIVTVLLTTGIRNKELLDLTLDDVDFLHKEIRIREGKGRKERIVDMDTGGLCEASIGNYLRLGGRPANIPDSAPLFGTTASHDFGAPQNTEGAEQYHRGSTAWLSQLVARHIENQTDGAVKGCRTHQLRHAFARLQLNATGNLAELQAALGHASPDITERYSNRLCERRRREEVLKVYAARDAAAEQLRRRNQHEQKVIPLFA